MLFADNNNELLPDEVEEEEEDGVVVVIDDDTVAVELQVVAVDNDVVDVDDGNDVGVTVLGLISVFVTGCGFVVLLDFCGEGARQGCVVDSLVVDGRVVVLATPGDDGVLVAASVEW